MSVFHQFIYAGISQIGQSNQSQRFGTLLSVAHFLSQNHHIFLIAVQNRFADRYGVGNGAVQIQLFSYFHISRYKRKRTGSTDRCNVPLHIQKPQIFRPAADDIGNHCICPALVSVKGFIIIGIQPFRDQLIAKIRGKQVSRQKQAAETAVISASKIIHCHMKCTFFLTG